MAHNLSPPTSLYRAIFTIVFICLTRSYTEAVQCQITHDRSRLKLKIECDATQELNSKLYFKIQHECKDRLDGSEIAIYENHYSFDNYTRNNYCTGTGRRYRIATQHLNWKCAATSKEFTAPKPGRGFGVAFEGYHTYNEPPCKIYELWTSMLVSHQIWKIYNALIYV